MNFEILKNTLEHCDPIMFYKIIDTLTPDVIDILKQQLQRVRIFLKYREQLTEDYTSMLYSTEPQHIEYENVVDCINHAITLDDVETLKYFHENGLKLIIYENYCCHACEYGSMKCLKFLLDNGCRGNRYCCDIAIYTNKLECLQMLCEKDRKISLVEIQELIDYAKNMHRKECLKYLQHLYVSII
jgi:hypothetical protein